MYVLYLSIIGLIVGSYFFGNINFSIIISHLVNAMSGARVAEIRGR